MNLSDAEIIKALECCTKGNTSDVCSDCPLLHTDICTEEENGVMKLALDLMNRQQAEIGQLRKTILDGDFSSYTALKAKENWYMENSEYIDRLKSENDRLKGLVLEFMDCVSKWSAKHDNDLSDEINKIPVMDKCRGKVKEIKSEAYKEFAEALKENAHTIDDDYSPNGELTYIEVEDIDNLLKKWGEG